MSSCLTVLQLVSVICMVSSEMELFTFILTQNALNDAPERYSNLIDDLLNQSSFDDKIKHWDLGCDYSDYYANAYFSELNYRLTFDNPEMPLTLNITNNGIYLYSHVIIDISLPVYVGGYTLSWKFWDHNDCYYSTMCPDHSIVSISLSIGIQSNLNITLNPTNNALDIRACNDSHCDVSAQILSHDVSECDGLIEDAADFSSWVLNEAEDIFHGTILEKLKHAMNEKANQIEESLQSFSPYDNITILYQLSELEFKAGEYMKMTVVGNISVQTEDEGSIVYNESNKYHLSMNWPEKYINNNYGDYLLEGARISPSILNGMLWAFKKLGKLNPSNTFKTSDAMVVLNSSFTIPNIEIIANHTIEVTIDRIDINITCWSEDDTDNFKNVNYSDYGSNIEFSIYDLTVTGGLAIQNESHLIAYLDSIDLDNINAVLNKPEIPIIAFGSEYGSNDVITNVLKSLANDSISYLNDKLKGQGVNISNYITNPNLKIVDISSNNINDYIELTTMCSCYNDSLGIYPTCFNVAKCNNTTISDETVTTTTTTPTTTMIQTSSTTNDQSEWGEGNVWMYLFSGPSTTIHSYSNNNSLCSINEFGDVERVIVLSNTDGNCAEMFIADDFSFRNLKENDRYYSLNMINDSVKNIHMFCNNSCDLDSCRYSGDDLIYGDCYPIIENRYNALFLSYFDDAGAGNTYTDDNNLILQSYFNSTACDSSIVILENIGSTNSCIPTDPKNKFYQSIVEQDLYFNLSVGCNQSSCSQCHGSFENIPYNECTTFITKNISNRLLFIKDLSLIGNLVVFANDTVYTEQPETSIMDIQTTYDNMIPTTTWQLVIDSITKTTESFLWLFYIIGAILLFSCIMYALISNYKKKDINCCCQCFKLSNKEKIQTFSCIFVGYLLMYQSYIWKNHNSWTKIVHFLEEFSQWLNIDEFKDILQNAHEIGIWIIDIYAALCFAMFILKFILKYFETKWSRIDEKLWVKLFAALLFIYVLLQFWIYIGTPLFYNLKESTTFKIGIDFVDNKYLLMVNKIWQYLFGIMYVAFLTNLMLFWINSIPSAIYIISLLFVYYQFFNYNDYNFATPKFMQYNIPKRAKIVLLCRIQICLFLFQATNSIVTMFPVILLYQIYTFKYKWIIGWFLWWIVPFILLANLFYCISKYIDVLKYPHRYSVVNNDLSDKEIPLLSEDDNDSKIQYSDTASPKQPWNIRKYKIFIILNLLIYILVMAANANIAFYIENSLTSSLIETRYIICNAMVTFLTTCIFTFVYLDLQFGKYHSETPHFNEKFTEDDIKQDGNVQHIIELLPTRDELDRLEQQTPPNLPLSAIPPPDGLSKQFSNVIKSQLSYQFDDPKKVGKRIPGRLYYLIIVMLIGGYGSFRKFWKWYINDWTTQQEIVSVFASFDIYFAETNEYDGTIFNDSFDIYSKMIRIEIICQFVAWIFVIAAVIFDIKMKNKKGLKRSKICVWMSIFLILVGIFCVILPNYLSAANIEKYASHCSSTINASMIAFCTVIIALCCLILFVLTVLPVLAIIPLPLIQCNYLILRENAKNEKNKLNKYEIQTITDIMTASSLLTPFLTFITALLFQQAFGDRITLILLLMYWILPILIVCIFKYEFSENKIFINIIYIIWLLSMYIPLLSIIFYSFPDYFFTFNNIEQKINFYLKIIADICLINVCLSDFIYSNLITINWSKIYQNTNQ